MKKSTFIKVRNKKTEPFQTCRRSSVLSDIGGDYKESFFNWSINTDYLCHLSGTDCDCYKCFNEKRCFSVVSISMPDFLDIIEKLNVYRTWTWRKLEQHNGTSCGCIEISKLDNKDYIFKHLQSLKLPDDVLYKMEITNNHRVWGIRRKDCFFIIWNDKGHYFYKHTNKNYSY